MTGADTLPPPGSRLVGEWPGRADLVALVDDFSTTWAAADLVNILRSLCRRLDIPGQFLLGSELLAAPGISAATPAAITWRKPEARAATAVARFGSSLPEGVLVYLLFHVARRLDPTMQRALAIEITAPLGPALSMWNRGSAIFGGRR